MNIKGSKHLDLQYRNFIEQGLNNNSSKSAIAAVIGMDKSSICKEIKKHAYEVKFSRQGVSAYGTYDAKISLPAALIHSAATRVLIVFLSLARSATKPEEYAMVVIRKALASSQSDFIQPKEPKRNINIGFPILVRVSILLTQN